MKVSKIIQTMIIFVSILLVAYWIWMRTPDESNTKLSKICSQLDLTEFNLVIENKSQNVKFDFAVKNNLDYYLEIDNYPQTLKTIVIGDIDYHLNQTAIGDTPSNLNREQKTVYKTNSENKLTESVSTFLNNALCYKRSYDIVEGKIYYVEYFYNINVFTNKENSGLAISKIYYKNDKIAFIEEGYEGDDYFDRYYIINFSNTVDENKFKIPSDYTWIEPE